MNRDHPTISQFHFEVMVCRGRGQCRNRDRTRKFLAFANTGADRDTDADDSGSIKRIAGFVPEPLANRLNHRGWSWGAARLRVFSCLLLILPLLPVAAQAADTAQALQRVTVVWLSIDGIRHDYPDRAETPTLDRLRREGIHTRQFVPGFPSLTFPAHVALATGAGVAQHGIPSNSFYDSRRQRVYRYPPWAGMVEAETLWQAATRQGLRVAVLDWPLAHAQRPPHAAAYFGDRFDQALSDRERLDALLDLWATDQADWGQAPLRLLATWIGDPDRAGHQYGPDAPEIAGVMQETDRLLSDFVSRAQTIWQQRAHAEDALVLAITTDHGMSPVHTLVNLARLLGLPNRLEGLTLVTSGNLANLHVDGLPEAEQAVLIDRLLSIADEKPFLRAYRRQDLPARWQYAHPYRTGDLVIVLEPGYAFSARPDAPTAPVEAFGGPFGMHGYDPETDPNMTGIALFWRWPEPWGGLELERIDMRQVHPSLAALLAIQPAETAEADPIAALVP